MTFGGDVTKLTKIESGTYYVPQLRNHAVFDSMALIDNVLYLFQATVNFKHTIKKRDLESQLSHLCSVLPNTTVNFAYVVPPDVFNDRELALAKATVDTFVLELPIEE